MAKVFFMKKYVVTAFSYKNLLHINSRCMTLHNVYKATE